MEENNLTNMSVPPENIAPPPPEPQTSIPKSRNISALIMLSILLIILVGIVAFLAYQNWSLQKQITSLQSVPSPSPVATADPTANWKTFSDNTSGIKFRYPDGWTSQKYTVDGNRVFGVAEIKVPGEDIGSEPALATISYWKNPNLLSLSNFQKGIDAQGGQIYILYDPTKELATQTEVGGMTAYFVQKSNCEPFTCSKYVIGDGSKIFEITLFPSSAKHQTNINQILSTFKFAEATSSGSPIPTQKACTLEAKICPNGSSVGRTGPNCEFAPCPQ